MRPTEEELKLALKKAGEIIGEIHGAERRMAEAFGISEEKLRAAVPEGISIISEEEYATRRGEEGVYSFRVVTIPHIVDVDDLGRFWPAVESILRDVSHEIQRFRRGEVTACTTPVFHISRDACLLKFYAYVVCLAILEKAPAEVSA